MLLVGAATVVHHTEAFSTRSVVNLSVMKAALPNWILGPIDYEVVHFALPAFFWIHSFAQEFEQMGVVLQQEESECNAADRCQNIASNMTLFSTENERVRGLKLSFGVKIPRLGDRQSLAMGIEMRGSTYRLKNIYGR